MPLAQPVAAPSSDWLPCKAPLRVALPPLPWFWYNGFRERLLKGDGGPALRRGRGVFLLLNYMKKAPGEFSPALASERAADEVRAALARPGCNGTGHASAHASAGFFPLAAFPVFFAHRFFREHDGNGVADRIDEAAGRAFEPGFVVHRFYVSPAHRAGEQGKQFGIQSHESVSLARC